MTATMTNPKTLAHGRLRVSKNIENFTEFNMVECSLLTIVYEITWPVMCLETSFPVKPKFITWFKVVKCK